MLCDYYLTLIGRILHEKGYGKHVLVEQYELNPLWQSSVNKVKWFNIRHLGLVVLTTLLIILISQVSTEATAWYLEFFISGLLVLLAAVVGRHISNILMFYYIIRNPDGLSGQIRFSHKAVVKFSQYQVLVAICPFVAVLLFTWEPYAIGGLCGLLLFFVLHARWLRKYDKRKKQISPHVPDEIQD
jgi:hypothetical protein